MKFCLSVLALLCAIAFARAASMQRDMVAETKIEGQLAAINPALVEPFRNAGIAMDKEDFAETVRLLTPLCQQAPNFDPALRRLGLSLAYSGHRAEGLAWAEKALTLNRSAANLSSVADILAFARGEKPSQVDLERAMALLKECRRLPDGQDPGTLSSTAQVAFQLRDWDAARPAVALLQQKYPDLMPTHYFAAVLAAVDEHWVQAEDEIRRAKKLGMDGKAAQEFLDSGIHTRALAWRLIRDTAWIVGLWLLGLTLLCGLGFLLSRTTLQQIERSDPNVPISAGEHRLRAVYRKVLNIAGVYYYISLPIVMVLVVAIAAAVIYGFLIAGWLPIKLMIILGIGAVGTVWSMGRSLFLRVPTEDPGRTVERSEAEALWQLAEEVATTVGTRPVDEIRVTPGTDLCVYERGSWREKMENRAKRVLVLGAAVLNDFKLEDFRCVLAHEYGHFSHRDTAGGDVALRVRNDMIKFYLAMYRAGQATRFNVAFHFLRAYNFIFRRISHGATRLQEVLADRVAAQAYGPLAFEGGLRHVVRRAIEFDTYANLEVKAALESKRPIANLYEAAPPSTATIEEQFEKAINRPTTEDDTHPAPRDRFRLIAPIPTPSRPPSPGTVWDLFKDRATVQREMMETVEKNVAPHRK